MSGRQRILPVRREYNRWVANETLEDYALRFTAKSSRRWAAPRVAQTAIGAISFLALEAIGGAITLSYGFSNAVAATLVVGVILFITGLPISHYAARYGVDVDLLTRGAGFGYIGSTVTSLVYATFTFILFAIEAAIMASALELCFGLPLWIGYIASAVAVIPLVTHGVTWISRFQLVTQPLWIGLNILPIGFIAWHDWLAVEAWTRFPGVHAAPGSEAALDILGFGAAASVILALMPQIGEQVDILRFLPARPEDGAGGARRTRRQWWTAMLTAGPGWIVLGAPKLLFGSFLAVLALSHAVPAERAAEPAYMYFVAFGYALPWETAVILLTAAFVVVSQLKINVMNAYAGSLAWSNFFARLTHSHPGRVVWLIFNVAIALLLMELGIYKALEQTLGLFAIVAVAWLGAIVADLAINKPLGLSPPGIEFKRAHLYDVNPVGCGAMALATVAALVAFAGFLGETAEALAPFVSLAVALVAAPAIAALTRGRYYLARKPRAHWSGTTTLECRICEHAFEPEDMAYCPAYQAPICSLCCSLDARCHDLCKPKARFEAQMAAAINAVLPAPVVARLDPRLGRYVGLLSLFTAVIGLILSLIAYQTGAQPVGAETVDAALWAAFFVLFIAAGIIAWFLVLAQDSRRVAQEESARQTTLLLKEIAAHQRTDAALQRAKEVAEAANLAKSRYVVGLSHELRTPLNAVLGYAQILERDPAIPAARQGGVHAIRRNAEHLAGLIDGLLDISKIEAGRLQVQRNAVRIGDFIEQLVDMFSLQARAKGLGFRLEQETPLPDVVHTDEKRLRQVLINLLSNAVKFTETGGVTLRVCYRNQVATLAVEDTGPGIAAADLDRIFEPFERAETAHAPGLGLGLTISKLLTQLMGGELTVESTPGRGSVFRVRLMLAAAAAPSPARPVRPITGYAGPRRTILVVDDDADHRTLMREALEPIGFEVFVAADGPSGLALAGEVRPDLFLLDVSMPGLTGFELAEALRRAGHVAPIVMLSANVGDRPKPAREDEAHDETMAKPFDLARLLDRLQALLGLEWIEAEPQAEAGPTATTATLADADIAELRRLGEIGYVRGIERKLDDLGADPAQRPLAALLRDHVRRFDMKGYAAALEALDSDG